MTDTVLLKKAPGDTPPTSAAAVGGPSLPPELLAEASRRLGWAGLIYAGTYTAVYFVPLATLPVREAINSLGRTPSIFAAVSIALGVVVFWLSRRSTMGPSRLLDLGLYFSVIGSAGIAAAEYWNGFPRFDMSAYRFIGVPWECVWIVIFPLVAPNTPRKILVASLASAVVGPIILFGFHGFTSPLVETPAPRIVVFFLFSTVVCAVLSYFVAQIVFRYNIRLKRAREVGSYALVERLGEGGMGEVWVASHRLLARPAAVKLIRPELLGADARSRETMVKRFEREARDTAALGSPHTVDVYDFGVSEDGAFFYVMELLDGVSLDGLVRQYGPLPPARVVSFLRQACHSLAEAHARGLIHRDIKPANIFVCRLGLDVDFVKLLDFGLVKHDVQTGEHPTETHLTIESVTVGTPAFMAPELALGTAPIDPRADLYSLGCVAYWLLTGKPVFEGATPVATILQHVQDVPAPVSARAELPVPAALEALIMACLAKSPADRPQSAVDLADRLDLCGVEAWTDADARDWWTHHRPPSAHRPAPPASVPAAGREA
jgi:serine/threonine-protein kinase